MNWKLGNILLFLFVFIPFIKASNDNQRDCPKGYFYAGEDSSNNRIINGALRGHVFYEEVSRSDVYSCYKVVEPEAKQNSGVTYFDALKGCSDLEGEVQNKARLISFDDGFNEIQRLAWKSFHNLKPMNHKILTSGLRLPNFENFVWSSTNDLYNISQKYIKIIGQDDTTLPCLVLNMKSPYEFTLEAVDCKDTGSTTYVCEVRVQMVTFYMWFVTNSWNLILLFSIVIMGVALCMSGFAYKSYPRYAGRRNAGCTNNRQSPVSSGITLSSPKTDLPPPYETYVNAQCVHDGLPPKYDSNGEPIGRLDQLKNKGKEILTTITVLKSRH